MTTQAMEANLSLIGYLTYNVRKSDESKYVSLNGAYKVVGGMRYSLMANNVANYADGVAQIWREAKSHIMSSQNHHWIWNDGTQRWHPTFLTTDDL